MKPRAARDNQNLIMGGAQAGTWWQQVSGEAPDGALAGRRLKKMPLLKDCWVDWKLYRPQTGTCAFAARQDL